MRLIQKLPVIIDYPDGANANKDIHIVILMDVFYYLRALTADFFE